MAPHPDGTAPTASGGYRIAASMRELAPDLWHLSSWPPNNINVYVIGDVLIDAGLGFHKQGILRQLSGHTITANALTHAHFDHYGSSHAICQQLDIPLWCGANDVEAVEVGKMVAPNGKLVRAARAHPVARALKEGDQIAGFQVLDTPGHSLGHVSYWRESDRVLVCGDVMWGYNPFLLMGPPMEPWSFINSDTALNRQSARRLAALEPALVCFGHGKPLRDTQRFITAVERLPG